MFSRSRFPQFRLAWCAALCGAVLTGATMLAPPAGATGVPFGGYLPLVGIALTDEFDDDLNTFAVPSFSPAGGTLLGNGGAHYDIALLDTGASISLLTAQAYLAMHSLRIRATESLGKCRTRSAEKTTGPGE